MRGSTTFLLQHLSQKHRPHRRQWCCRRQDTRKKTSTTDRTMSKKYVGGLFKGESVSNRKRKSPNLVKNHWHRNTEVSWCLKIMRTAVLKRTGNKITFNTSQSAQTSWEVNQTTQTSYSSLNQTEFVRKVKQSVYLKSPVLILLYT